MKKTLQPVLSICIPTYNRAGYILETVHSIIKQDNGQIEIVISDNASSDNTREIISKLQKDYSFIHYFCNDENLGADLNYLKSVEHATGEYCWLMGSDDIMTDHALADFFESINQYQDTDIVMSNRMACDVLMNPIREERPYTFRNDVHLKIHSDIERKEFINECAELMGLFSYLSIIIVRRERWLAVKFDYSYIGTAYSHVFFLLKIICQGCKLQYINKISVLTRLGNDAFYEGNIQRAMLDINGYTRLSEIFQNSALREQFKEKVRSFLPIKSIIATYIYGREATYPKSVLVSLGNIGYSKLEIYTFFILANKFMKRIVNILRPRVK